MIQRLLHNPYTGTIALASGLCAFLLLLGLMFIQKIRRQIKEESDLKPAVHNHDAALAIAAYGGIVEKMRQQERDLQRLRADELEKAATAAQISETVISNLSSGVVFFDRLGIVRQANHAAKTLLGYASPQSFHIRDLFRGISRVTWPVTGEEVNSAAPFIQAMQQALREGSVLPKMKVDYLTPAGHKRVLRVSAAPVQTKSGDIHGLSCLIDDLTSLAEISQEAERKDSLASLGEISAGLIQDFRRSLDLIRNEAQLLAAQAGDDVSREHAQKVLREVDSLARLVGEFLEFARPQRRES